MSRKSIPGEHWHGDGALWHGEEIDTAKITAGLTSTGKPMNAKAKHTPGPWEFYNGVILHRPIHTPSSGATAAVSIAQMLKGAFRDPDVIASNARLIVTAVNHHAEMVELLREWQEWAHLPEETQPNLAKLYVRRNALLAKIDGEG